MQDNFWKLDAQVTVLSLFIWKDNFLNNTCIKDEKESIKISYNLGNLFPISRCSVNGQSAGHNENSSKLFE